MKKYLEIDLINKDGNIYTIKDCIEAKSSIYRYDEDENILLESLNIAYLSDHDTVNDVKDNLIKNKDFNTVEHIKVYKYEYDESGKETRTEIFSFDEQYRFVTGTVTISSTSDNIYRCDYYLEKVDNEAMEKWKNR